MPERRETVRRSEDVSLDELYRWIRRAALGYVILLAAVVVGFFRIGDTIDQNAEQGAQIKRQAQIARIQAEHLRQQSIAACKRGNDVRRDIQASRDVLGFLVTAILEAGGPSNPELQDDFLRAARKLERPVPQVDCQRSFR